jgi:hypothetical protein
LREINRILRTDPSQAIPRSGRKSSAMDREVEAKIENPSLRSVQESPDQGPCIEIAYSGNDQCTVYRKAFDAGSRTRSSAFPSGPRAIKPAPAQSPRSSSTCTPATKSCFGTFHPDSVIPRIFPLPRAVQDSPFTRRSQHFDLFRIRFDAPPLSHEFPDVRIVASMDFTLHRRHALMTW